MSIRRVYVCVRSFGMCVCRHMSYHAVVHVDLGIYILLQLIASSCMKCIDTRTRATFHS